MTTPAEQVYDFESLLEEVFRTALAGAALMAYTVTTVPSEDDPTVPSGEQASQQFQKYRPRCVVSFLNGAGIGRLLPETGYRVTAGNLREQAYEGDLTIGLVTAADIVMYRQYRAQVRAVLDVIVRTINTGLTAVTVQAVMPAGSTQEYAAQNGAYVGNIRYRVRYSLNPSIFAVLNQ